MTDISIRPDGMVVIDGLVAGLAIDVVANWPDHAETVAAHEAARIAEAEATVSASANESPLA